MIILSDLANMPKLPDPEEVAKIVDRICPRNFKDVQFNRRSLVVRKPGDPIPEGMSVTFKDDATTLYVRQGERFLRCIDRPGMSMSIAAIKRMGVPS
jgi:hypothetical protein